MVSLCLSERGEATVYSRLNCKMYTYVQNFPLLFPCSQWRTQEFCLGGGVSTNSVEERGQRERGSGGGSPLVRGSEGSCNLVQEILFHIVKFS